MTSKPSTLYLLRGLLGIALLCSFFIPTPARAATLTVTNLSNTNDGICDADCSLREALSVAVNGDTIAFSAGLDGTIELGSTLVINQNITLDGTGANISLSGDVGNIQVISVSAGATVTLSHLALIHGNTSRGGGIYNAGTLTVTNCTLSQNLATFGGAIYNDGSLTLDNSTLLENQAEAYGGGVSNHGQMTISNTLVSLNTAPTGAGLYDVDHLTVINTTVISNTASLNGGGLTIAHTGSTILRNSTLIGNSTTNSGGGIYINSQGTALGSALVENSTLTRNRAQAGAGILSKGNLTLHNATIIGNQASIEGGGLYNAGPLDMANTILAQSVHGADCYNEPPLGLLGTNLQNFIGANASGTEACGAPALTGNPHLSAAAGSYGGPTLTYALQNDSPLIDAGDNATCLAVGAVDQRGQQRADLQCDIGAFELQLTDSPTVTRQISAPGVYTFGPTQAQVEIIAWDACLSNLQIGRFNANHPHAGSPNLQTGVYWSIDPSCAAGFEASLSLPALNFDAGAYSYSKLCRWAGSAWDCGEDGQNTVEYITMADGSTQDYIRRQPVTAFSQWAAGYYLNPTAIHLSRLTARSSGSWITPFNVLVLLAAVLVVILRRRM